MKNTGEDLVDFVQSALEKGISRNEIENTLTKVGWPDDQVKKALNAFADVEFPIPVPKPHSSQSAKESFLYLLLFTTLAIFAVNLGSLLFQLIDMALPVDVSEGSSDWSRRRVRWAISFILVSFPIFVFITGRVNKMIRKDPDKRRSRIRKWITYLTLFVAACIVIGDTTTLLYNLLGSELTLRFILKVIVIAAISGSIYAHYLRSLRQDEKEIE